MKSAMHMHMQPAKGGQQAQHICTHICMAMRMHENARCKHAGWHAALVLATGSRTWAGKRPWRIRTCTAAASGHGKKFTWACTYAKTTIKTITHALQSVNLTAGCTRKVQELTMRMPQAPFLLSASL